MADFDVIPTRHGCRLDAGDLAIEAESPYLDRGVIRATLTVRQDGAIHHRDTVNLTSERSRAKLLAKLAEKAIDLDERAIVALDEACRARPSFNGDEAQKKTCDGAPVFSGTVPTLAALTRVVRRWLLLGDRDLLPIVLGAVCGHRLAKDASPWLLLVAPSSGTKTEVLRMLWAATGIFPLSELTARTLASGLDNQGKDPSLLARLSDEILVLKDLTTVLELRPDERQAIFAQLREVYDGRYDKAWGTGKELHWRGRLGFLAGVTAVIDQHHHAMAILGPRFVLLRSRSPDRESAAVQAMANNGREEEMRDELAGATATFLASLGDRPRPAVPADTERWLAKVATFTTIARSPVLRDGYKRELDHAPEPEMPMRFAKQLKTLAQGIALVSSRQEVGPKERRRIARVALDCIPAIRRLVLLELAEQDGDVGTGRVAAGVQCATTTARRALEDLQALKLVVRISGGKGKEDRWRPTQRCRSLLTLFDQPGTVPEKPRAPSHNNNDGQPLGAERGKMEDDRQPRCWRCATALTAETHAACAACGWLTCDCGACSADCAVEPAAPFPNGHQADGTPAGVAAGRATGPIHTEVDEELPF